MKKALLRKLPISMFLLINLAYATELPAVKQEISMSPRDEIGRFGEAQAAEIKARVELANAIVRNVQEDAKAKGATDSWRVGLLSSLYNVPSEALRNIATIAKTLDEAHALAVTGTKPAGVNNNMVHLRAMSLGSSADNLVFTPVATCRFIDTRNVGGPVVPGTPRDFDTSLLGSTYGGAAACALPGNGEPAIVANVTVVVSAGIAGYLGIRPVGTTAVTSLINWGSGGADSGLANATILPTALNSSGNYAFEIFVGGAGAVSVTTIMDYLGYFAPATSAAKSLDCVSSGTSTQTLTAGQVASFSAPACPAGYVATTPYCYTTDPQVASQGSGILSNTAAGTTAFCAWHNTGAGVSGNTQNAAQCCRTASY